MKNNFTVKPFQLKVEKPWGFEVILAPDEAPVIGKIIHVNENCRLSLQYHEKKEELLSLLNGRAVLIIENEKGETIEVEMEQRKGYLIKPFQKHRLKGITDCEILESSLPEKGKTVRVEDDYKRSDETEQTRKTRTNKGVYIG